jgi:hypothetical protein
MPVGFCINSSSNNGTIAIRVASGYKITELHDVQISSPVDRASLYYRGGLWRDTTEVLLVSDTSSMLTNYLRSGVAASTYVPSNTSSTMNANLSINGNLTLLTGGILTTPILSAGTIIKQGGTTSQFLKANGDVDSSTYLRTGLADSTYLPLAGGTLSKLSNLNNFTDSILKISYTPPAFANDQNITGLSININNRGYTTTGITSEASTVLNNAIGVKGKATQSDVNGTGIAYGVIGEASASGSGTNGSTYAGYFNNTSTVGGTHYGLFVNTASGGDYGIYQTGTGINYFGSNSTFAGTLGVTGATTLSGALTVNNATVLNEGSGDFDTRIESDGNANMVFVDASTDRVGIGTGTPSKTLDINGEVKIATVTATPTSLLGKDGSNVVGEVTTVAQTGLMTRGSTTATTGTPSAVFTVTHGLGSNPTSVIVTGAGAVGAQKLIFEVYAKNSTTFSVQVWTYLGLEAASTSVTIYWLAIK